MALASALDTLLVDQQCLNALRGAATTTTIDPWQHERAVLRDLPEHERERLRRVSIRHSRGVDAAHPPTYLRVELLDAARAVRPQVVLDESTSAAIDEELRPYFAKLILALAKAELARIDTR